MDIDAMHYQEKVVISGSEYEASRNRSTGQVNIPYTNAPDADIGDIITLKSGPREMSLRILDLSFIQGGTLNIGTNHPNLLQLTVENLTSAAHKPSTQSSTINIGSIAGEHVQVGNQNSQTFNISIQHLAEKIAQSSDPEAKSLLKKLLENSTVGSLIGAGVSVLLGKL
ncbi:hypothetical protein [Cellvibrio polysaccharolyticus]|uniref:Uncharacterized protein n=1 Tax=Cellvibrio polysaccharolyticus TaxID=2082724 RepID=A0A928V193_9GAMM|nr:hypothetical protein [Cellvibrio polysaccharolyticus]MBE8715938.1 hypothetical protein [Cellvibrio polysaccharolyticus]